MPGLRDGIVRGILILFLIAALCSGVAHLARTPASTGQQTTSAGRYHLTLAIATAEDAAGSHGAGYSLHLNSGLPAGPLSACNPCISTSRNGRETAPSLSFLCELLC